MICGTCRHFTAALGAEALLHIRRGRRGECIRPDGWCPNEREGQYTEARLRYEKDPAGARFEPRER